MNKRQKEHTGNPWYKVRASKEDTNTKTDIYVDPKVAPLNADWDALLLDLNASVSTIQGHRPSKPRGTPFKSPGGRPTEKVTPNGTILKRQKDLGWLIIFASMVNEDRQRHLPTAEDLERVNKFLKDSTKPGHIKNQEIVITAEQLQNFHFEKIPRNQSKVMASDGHQHDARATNIAKQLHMALPNEQFEWLHNLELILGLAVEMLFDEVQNKDNISGGTKFANTDMILGEDAAKFVALKCGQIKLSVKSEEFGAHFAKTIRLTIKSKGLDLSFVFDALTQVNSTDRHKSYVHALVSTLVDNTLRMESTKSQPAIEAPAKEEPSSRFKKMLRPMPLFFSAVDDDKKGMKEGNELAVPPLPLNTKSKRRHRPAKDPMDLEPNVTTKCPQ